MSKEQQIDAYEAQIRVQYPSWNNADIRAKAVRMYYFGEKLLKRRDIRRIPKHEDKLLINLTHN